MGVGAASRSRALTGGSCAATVAAAGRCASTANVCAVAATELIVAVKSELLLVASAPVLDVLLPQAANTLSAEAVKSSFSDRFMCEAVYLKG